MIRLVLAGMWICAVTSAAAYLTSDPGRASAAAAGDGHLPVMEHVRTRQITVPRIEDGAIRGYVVAQFGFTADASALRQMTVPAEVFVVDEAFRAIYAEDSINFDSMQRADLAALTAAVAGAVNTRLGSDLVGELMVEQFDYVPRETLGDEVVTPAQNAAHAADKAPKH